MLKKASRRVIGFVVAALIASVAAAQPVPAAAPASGTLFGVAGCLQFCRPALDRLDPASGAETPFADLGQVGSGWLVADPANHRLYAEVVTFGGGRGGGPIVTAVRTIDSQTGAVTTTPDLSVTTQDVTLDPSTHTVFGLLVTFTGSTPSTSVVRLDPATGTITPVAAVPNGAHGLTYDPASHTLYTETSDFTQTPPTGQLIAIDTQSGTVSAGTALSRAVANLVFDTSAGALYGVIGSFPNQFVQVSPSTGTETQIGSFAFPAGFATAVAIDPGTHSVFFVETDLVNGGQFVTTIATVNDQTGASTLSPQTAQPVWAIAFQPPPVTPESIQSEARAALASGAIDNAGVAGSLLAKLSAAADARSRGQCATSANVYGSFINDLSAQGGKHVAAATAAQLTVEAQFLIANCP